MPLSRNIWNILEATYKVAVQLSIPAHSQIRHGKTPLELPPLGEPTKTLGDLPGIHSCTSSKAKEKAKVAVKAAQKEPIETGPRSPASATSAAKPATDDMNAQPKTMDNLTKSVHPRGKATKERPRAREKVSTPPKR